jgi:hypothetical protein
MMLLSRVAAALQGEGIEFALIGAAAMAAHGVSRSTMDLDLLVTDQRTLRLAWSDQGFTVEVRPGGMDDPLAGVIRFLHPEARAVDIVVGRERWQREVVRRARTLDVGELQLPVVEAVDLILLKLYAGGSQDAWDIEQLLGAVDRARTVAAVDALVGELPASSRALWDRLRPLP